MITSNSIVTKIINYSKKIIFPKLATLISVAY